MPKKGRARRKPTPSGTDTLIPRGPVRDVTDSLQYGKPSAGPATPAPPPMPAATYDSVYNNDLAVGQAAYETTLAGINLGRSRLGYDTGFDPNGQVNLSNPYNQAMLLQRTWEQSNRGITNSMASRGQLYSGARQRGINESNFQYERSRNDLQTRAQRGYEDLTLAERQAGNERDLARYDAEAGQAERWRQQQKDWYELYG